MTSNEHRLREQADDMLCAGLKAEAIEAALRKRIQELEAELKAASVKRFFDEVNEAVAAEGERCAKIAESYKPHTGGLPKHIQEYVDGVIDLCGKRIAAAIRGDADE